MVDIDYAGRLIAMRLTELRKELEAADARREADAQIIDLLTHEKAQLEAALEKLGA